MARTIALRIAYAVVAALLTTGIWIVATTRDGMVRGIVVAAALLIVTGTTAAHVLLTAADVRRELAESERRMTAAIAKALQSESSDSA
ncbi:ABC-type transport system involved in cytochrome bd biosynthesis fused ATPase/permease subunit [Hamadaea flava]|uniref:DUF4229 domain-containing protein n=1 Tax=Hamadaea flava TaxID=1742688 RepID=A0ABV8LNA4_9ACTN|nr:hypothetical protein [Hamadaea flava]MCP2322902.1 ABC-type transport system involved in cytochrome bd biosynthesis fused ATPase/permease subunit [Hamadaea flava]